MLVAPVVSTVLVLKEEEGEEEEEEEEEEEGASPSNTPWSPRKRHILASWP